MIPFIRTLPELMAITESKENRINISKKIQCDYSTVDSGQRKRYIRSLKKDEINLPDLPKEIRYRLISKKESISKFIDDIEYNTQIQSSYDLTLLQSQNKTNQKDAA